jgi:hypothetical protein
MRWLSKISLFLLFFSIPLNFSPQVSQLKCNFLTAWGNNETNFGTKGKDGEGGKDGQQGRNAENITIFADDSPLNLNLVGHPGEAGKDGGNGNNASCTSQPSSLKSNLRGANGGDGGDGGNGGDGGDGGSITVYTTNKKYLQQILVQANGGAGGTPGKGGNGGNGCQCTQSYWTVDSCSGNPGTPNYVCNTQEFRCFNGEKGNNGRSGRAGREGKMGNLTLINSNKPLAPDRTSASVTMAELKNTGFSLSKNIWETRNGAVSLFAPGSIIADQYVELVERVENSIVFIWNAPQPFEPFAQRLVTLNLKDDRSVEIKIPDDIWLESGVLQRNNITEFFVSNIIQAKEATQLESKGLSGVDSNLRLELIDKAQRSDIVSTQFYLKYSTTLNRDASWRKVSDYTLKYEGEIPSQFINHNGNNFIIDLGKMDIEPEYLKSGTAVKIQIEATRTFGDKSAQQKIEIYDILGPFK